MAGSDAAPRPDALLREVLIARQPIVDRDLAVVGYEVLYRDATGDGPAVPQDAVSATASILIDGVIGLGRELIADGELAFVNVPVALLTDRFFSMISRAAPRWSVTSIPSLLRLAKPAGPLLRGPRTASRHGAGGGLEAVSAGMSSVLGPDALLGPDTVAQLLLEGEVRAALLGEANHLRGLLDIQVAAEAADWPRLVKLGAELGFSTTDLAAAHVDAATWAGQLNGTMSSAA